MSAQGRGNLAHCALLLLDLQNDFIHPDGAYARGGLFDNEMRALPGRLKPLAGAMRASGGWIVSSHFTLIPGRDGNPIISPHLQRLRPFLRKGDFAAGAWGHRLVDELAPSDLSVEKVAYSAFYMTRLEWLLRKCSIDRLVLGGIVTNGAVASTARDAHLRDIEVTVLEDGCAAFSPDTHHVSIEALRSVARIASIAEIIHELTA